MKRNQVFFFDVRNTLGVVDRKGHLIRFRPSVDELLKGLKAIEGTRLCVLTNAPPGVDATQMLHEAGLADYFEKVISTQDPDVLAARAEKPHRAIYEIAANSMSVDVGDCTYISENLLEVLGAINAGMHGIVKKFPPGGDYMRVNLGHDAPKPGSSGRVIEALLESQHMVGKRVVVAATRALEQIKAGEDPLKPGSNLLSGIGRLVWIVNHFIDPYHHKMEEEILLEFGHLRGYPRSKSSWLTDEHEQGRSYFKAMSIALHRIQSGNGRAVIEFANLVDAFVQLYKAHGEKEDNELFPEIGELLTDADDALMCGMIERMAPPDITLHYDMIQAMETDLGVQLT